MAAIKCEITIGAPFVKDAKVAYKFAKGPFEGSGEIIGEVSQLAPATKWIGLYYGNPEKVREADLKYAAGAILAEGDEAVHPGLQKELEKAGFKIFQMPHVDTNVLTTFPYVRGSQSHKQVYPQLMKYIDEHNLDLNVMVHVFSKGDVQIMGPQANTDAFFVPEARA